MLVPEDEPLGAEHSQHERPSQRPSSRVLLICGIVPVLFAAISFAILRAAWMLNGPRMMTTPGGRTFWTVYEKFVFPGNALVAAAIAAVIMGWYRTEHAGRMQRVASGFLSSLILYVLAYVLFERLYHVF